MSVGSRSHSVGGAGSPRVGRRPGRLLGSGAVTVSLVTLLQACAGGATPPPTPRPAATAPLQAAGGATVERGKALFVSNGCAACHTLSAVPGATGNVGPSLDGVGARAASRRPGVSAEAYLRESIQSPNAFVVPGFQPLMPQLPLADDELAALVALLLAQQ